MPTTKPTAAPCASGGTLRRVGFAAAIDHQPQLLILDEPTTGLDPIQPDAQGAPTTDPSKAERDRTRLGTVPLLFRLRSYRSKPLRTRSLPTPRLLLTFGTRRPLPPSLTASVAG